MPAPTELRGLRVHLLVTGRADASAMATVIRENLDATVFPELTTAALAGRPAEVEAAVERAVHVDPHDLVIVAVPLDLSLAVRADRVVLDNLETPLPGLGELQRVFAARVEEPEAWLLPSGGGTRGGALVVVVPARPAFFAQAWHRVLGPQVIAALASMEGDVTLELPEGSKPGAGERVASGKDEGAALVAPAEEAAPGGAGQRPGVAVEGRAIGQGSAPDPEEDAPVPSWQRALDSLGAVRQPEVWPELPEAFDRMAAAREVLDGAGERATVELESGERCALYGFPDLQRPGSKVLLVRRGDPLPEVVALHRHPRPVGVLVSGDDGLLPSADLLPDPLAEERTGRPTPNGGFLFALEQDGVYVERGGRVYRWDGRAEEEMGTPRQAYASLVLKWSQL